MPVESMVIQGLYRDSVELMRIASEVQSEYELEDAQALMGTPANKQQLTNNNVLNVETVCDLSAEDLILTVSGPETVTQTALDAMSERLQQNNYQGKNQKDETTSPRTIAAATDDTNPSIALISVPGDYAVKEAWQALNKGLNVQLFSDNVGLESERRLKKEGVERGQLVMGPDCGSTIINGVPLGFANVVADGPVGLVSASGTGLQEVSVLIDRLGSGISHALGVGGRDLSDEVGAIGTCQTLELLDSDESTEVIVLISKPPGENASQSILETVEACSTPIITCLLGSEDDLKGVKSEANLTDAALRAVNTVSDGISLSLLSPSEELHQTAMGAFENEEHKSAIRGLFVGGTLCTEATVLLNNHVETISSNVGIGDPITDPLNLDGHAMIDFGADELTTGRPHPMIDPTLRTRQLKKTLKDPSVSIVLLDVVLGHGSHIDPSAEIATVVDECPDPPLIVASVCGTDADPQTRHEQVSKLETVGVHVAPSNATAVAEITALLERVDTATEVQ